MKHELKKGLVVVVICFLMLVTIPIAISDNNDDIPIANGEKHNVYFRGSNFDGMLCQGDLIKTPLGLIHIFRGEKNDYVKFFFRDRTGEIDTRVKIIENGKQDIYNRDVSIEFILNSKNSFVVFFTFPTDSMRAFAICDSVTVSILI